MFGLPWVAMVVFGAVISKGDPAIIGHFAAAGAVAVVLIAVLSLPFVRGANAWKAAPLERVAKSIPGARVEVDVGGERHLRVEEDGGVSTLFWTETQEVAGDEGPGRAWTCVGRLRSGRGAPAVEIRFQPGKEPELRWSNRWWDEMGRGAPPDPLSGEARAAAEQLASVFPNHETRFRFDGDLVAYAVPGHIRDPAALLALFYAAGPVLKGM